MSALDVSDLRCPKCGADTIVEVPANNDSAATAPQLQCAGCHVRYDHVFGVPFLGSYEREEILGLVEIAANVGNRGKFGVTPAVVEQWEALLSDYHKAVDKPAFISAHPMAQSPYLLNRYGEWSEINALTEGIDVRGWRILDMGAGLGFDAHRLAMWGASVTALEFSPVLAEWGAQSFPHIRWVGGLSDVLPFEDASFDAVFCNAALHHMRDIPAALQEALRVLRPGGYLITTCDSFRSDSSDQQFELRVFDRDPAVLSGVNERIPRFSEFATTLQRFRDAIDVTIYTHTLYNAPMADGGSKTLSELTAWDFDKDYKMLSERGGSLAIKARLKEPISARARVQQAPVLEPAEFARCLDDQSAALTRLAPLVPDACINLPFPGKEGEHSKFELLNGWRLPQRIAQSRVAYKRARWFLKRRPDETSLSFQVRLPRSIGKPTPISVLINGRPITSGIGEPDRWMTIEVNLDSVAPDVSFALEIRIAADSDEFESSVFEVRRRRFGPSSRPLSLFERLSDVIDGWREKSYPLG